MNKESVYLIYTKFCAIYGDKFVKPYHTEKFIELWVNEWAEGLLGIEDENIKKAIHHCKANLSWSPSLPEFIDICDKMSGLPSFYDAYRLASALCNDRRFEGNKLDNQYHPVVRLCLDKVGSWDMGNKREDALIPIFKEAYANSLAEWKEQRNTTAKQLEASRKIDHLKVIEKDG